VPVCSPISCSSESHSSNASCASLFLLFLKQQHYLSFTLGETAYIIIIIIIIHHEVGTNRRVLLSFKRHFTDLANRLRPFGQQFIFGILLLINLFTCGSQFDLYLYNCWSTGFFYLLQNLFIPFLLNNCVCPSVLLQYLISINDSFLLSN